ncbi:MAG: hypothetical protein IT456_26080 [Planctomycetes bacterium]|jgi:hypothetical protein|nr:hypothetical protein [Planctomycetota bacterium]
MGNQRLGPLPRSKRWQQLVGLIVVGAGASQVATATIDAAEQGLSQASKDQGFVETMWLLTQLPQAARSGNFAAALRTAGLDVPDNPTLMDVVGAFADAVDHRLGASGRRTDLGEMAQMAANETLCRVLGERTQSLFGTDPSAVQREMGKLGTHRQFSIFCHQFFARLTERYLNYFLSRTLPQNIGEGRRFTTLAQQAEFSKALGTHCDQATRIMQEFSGSWFSKTNWETGGITRKQTSGFVHIAMKKIVGELKEGARPLCPSA